MPAICAEIGTLKRKIHGIGEINDPSATAKYGLSALTLALVAGHAEVALLSADAGTDLSLRGTGAPGFAGKTAYDLAVEREMRELSAAMKPRP